MPAACPHNPRLAAVRQAARDSALALRLALYQPTADMLALRAETAARLAANQNELFTPTPSQL